MSARGRRRDDILEAGRRSIAERGFDRTTTAEVCRRADVSSGTFFHYFPTKTALLAAILEEDLERTRTVLSDIVLAAAADAAHALILWRNHVVRTATDEDLAAFVVATGALPDDPRVGGALAAEQRSALDALAVVVEAGRAQGIVRHDLPADRVATWLQVLADGVLVQAVERRPVAAVLEAELADAVARLVAP